MRTTRRGGVRGYDAGKKVLGRKRHLLVDTDGLILKVRVHAADVQDREGAALLLDQLDEPLCGIKQLWADGGFLRKRTYRAWTPCEPLHVNGHTAARS